MSYIVLPFVRCAVFCTGSTIIVLAPILCSLQSRLSGWRTGTLSVTCCYTGHAVSSTCRLQFRKANIRHPCYQMSILYPSQKPSLFPIKITMLLSSPPKLALSLKKLSSFTAVNLSHLHKYGFELYRIHVPHNHGYKLNSTLPYLLHTYFLKPSTLYYTNPIL